MTEKSCIVSILAGGSGLRFNNDSINSMPKQFAKYHNKTLIEMSIEAFENNCEVDGIIIVMNRKWINDIKQIVENNNYQKILAILPGGKTRFDSSLAAIEWTKKHYSKCGKFLIHDAVRPFVSQEIITDIIKALNSCDAVEPVIKTTETLVKIDTFGVPSTVDRSIYATVQTPQGFKFKVISNAFEIAKVYMNNKTYSRSSWRPTDDISVVEEFSPRSIRNIIEGDVLNKKITFKSDLNS